MREQFLEEASFTVAKNVAFLSTVLTQPLPRIFLFGFKEIARAHGHATEIVDIFVEVRTKVQSNVYADCNELARK